MARFLFIGRAPRNRTARATAELVRIERAKAAQARAIAKGEAAAAPRAAQAAAGSAIVDECMAAIASMRERRLAGEDVPSIEVVEVQRRLAEAARVVGS